MKMRPTSFTAVGLSLLVGIGGALTWWGDAPGQATSPSVAATASGTVTTALVTVQGTVTGQPESVAFSGQARISSALVLDTSRFATPPAVFLTIDLSNVSGTGSSTGTKYVAGVGSSVRRHLVSADLVEITFPFFRSTNTGASSARSGVASFALSFDLNTGAITNGTGTVATPNFPD